ncbi:MAG: hypothetical protein KAI73_11345 [Rhodospirillaceae bacterium]|nr:hypothetical protein [Rhodospirillaceae bacterium]
MTTKMYSTKRVSTVFILTSALLLGAAPAMAEEVPSAPEASPEVYKIIAENDQFRVIEATWKPGQQDKFHSHPADRVSLFETNCALRLTNPDGTYRDAKPKGGKAVARTGKPVASHYAKNMGDSICILRIVELK